MNHDLPYFKPFDTSPDAGDIAPRWNKWVNRFKNLMTAINVTDPIRQRALLLHYIGEEGQDIFDILPNTTPASGEDPLEKAITALTNHFTPKQNTEFEVYKFRQSKQSEGEDIMAFYTRLKTLATTCEFTNPDSEIKSQIVQNCTSNKLRRKALTDPTMNLQKLLDLARAMELASAQAADMQSTAAQLQSLQVSGETCRNCGQSWPHATVCPAKGKECYSCKKLNHFAIVCRSTGNPTPQKPRQRRRRRTQDKHVRHLSHDTSSDSDDDSYLFALTSRVDSKRRHDVYIYGHKINMMIDSGADINIIDSKDFGHIRQHVSLLPSNRRIYPYGSDTPLTLLGKFKTVISTKFGESEDWLYVTYGRGGSLLGFDTSVALGILKINTKSPSHTTVKQLAVSKTPSTCSSDRIANEFPSLFTGLGKLKGVKVKLHIDNTVKPAMQKHRHIPFHTRKHLEQQLKLDQELDVVEKVEGPTPWVSPVVVVPKKTPGQVRVCVDMRKANTAIIRERHITPTINELVSDLNGASVFSKLDLNQGYNQLELDESSRYITTFSTHLGLFRYKRLSFGISSAAEVFQNAIRTVLQGLPGTLNYSDDILVFGRDQADHDKNLRQCLQRLSEHNLTLNRSKCEFSKSNLKFFGHIFSSSGLSADPDKVQAIKTMKAPTCVSELRSFLGMSNFFCRFIPNYATMTEPLRNLIKDNTEWKWTTACDQTLQSIQQALSDAPVLTYFDVNKPTEIYTDASPVGLGAILTQCDDNSRKSVIAYASRSLTDVEQRYSQTEREALAVVWACEHFNLYIYGKPVTVISDHKPLEGIFNNSLSLTSTRIQRWTLRLQPYDVTVKYRPGKDHENPADFLSRQPCKFTRPSSREEKMAEGFVNYVVSHSIPKALSLEEVRTTTQDDPTLQFVISGIQTGCWTSPDSSVDTTALQTFVRVQNELTVSSDNILLRGHRIVLPASLQQKAVTLAHEGHQGIVRTKALLREKVWFPGIDALVEHHVKGCLDCQVAVPDPTREPLMMSPLPHGPWEELSADFAHLPTGDYLFVVHDDYSRFPVVEIISSTSARTVLPRLDRILSEYGIPRVIRTDNGPPFQGREFAQFMSNLGIAHRKVTPLWPRANGEVERFMRTIKKVTKVSKYQPNWKQLMYQFLRNYRSTPHASTGSPPSTLLFSRQLKTKLPELSQQCVHPDVEQRDSMQKRKMKDYADQKCYVHPNSFEIGDSVIVKRPPNYRKSDTPYDPRPCQILEKKGSMITVAQGDRRITRNSSFFKKVDEQYDPTQSVESDEESHEITSSDSPDQPASPVSPVPPGPDAVRRSARITRPPKHLQDFVLS